MPFIGGGCKGDPGGSLIGRGGGGAGDGDGRKGGGDGSGACTRLWTAEDWNWIRSTRPEEDFSSEPVKNPPLYSTTLS